MPRNLKEISLHVVNSFTNQLECIRHLRARIEKLVQQDPFSKENSDLRASSSVSCTLSMHMRIFRQGADLIENVFTELHSLIDRAKSDYKKRFRE